MGGKTFQQRLRHALGNLAMPAGLSAADVAHMQQRVEDTVTHAARKADEMEGPGAGQEFRDRMELLNDTAVRELAECELTIYLGRIDELHRLSA
jgi:transposase